MSPIALRPIAFAATAAVLMLVAAPAQAHHSNKSEHAAEILSLSAAKKKGARTQERRPKTEKPAPRAKPARQERQPRAK